ncbi:hypothetical protein D3C71_1331160 [compost metagenome]
MSALQGFLERLFIDNSPSCGVDQQCTRFHHRQLLSANQRFLVTEWKVNSDRIGGLQPCADVTHSFNAELGKHLVWKIGIVGSNPHAETFSQPGHLPANTAETQDEQRPSGHFHRGKPVASVPFTFTNTAVEVTETFSQSQQQGEGMFSHRQ